MLSVFLLASSVAHAALKVGDPAPRIAPGKWAQGEAIKELEGDKVYIVEFWATWCGPCIAVIPHINDFSKRYAKDGLVVVGQNLGEDEKTVNAFVRKMGSKMSYRVAVDDASAKMANTWLRAAGQNGIPCAFVVNKKGRIAYIGHPMSFKEEHLKKLLAEPGTKPAPTNQPEVATAPSEKAQQLFAQAQTLLVEGKTDEAGATIAELHKELPDEFRYLGGLLELELMIVREQHDEAAGLAEFLSEDFSSQPAVVVAVAQRLARSPKSTPTMLKTAEKLSRPLASSKNPSQADALAVLARVSFLQGNAEQAVTLQTQAVEASSPDQAAAARAILSTYQEARLP